MQTVELFKEYLGHLFAGRRSNARELIFSAHDRGFGAERLLSLVIWPAMEQMDKLYRENHISRIVLQMGTRINRMIADQLQGVLNRKPKDGRRIVVMCGAEESAELGGQILSDLFESDGWSVWFIGSAIPNDEILPFLSKADPDIFLVYASLPPEVPEVRKLIALVREVGVCPQMQFMVCGGVYNRAEDLAEEIQADLFARTAREALQQSAEHPTREDKTTVLEPGRRRKRKSASQKAKVQKLREQLTSEDSEGNTPEDIAEAEETVEELDEEKVQSNLKKYSQEFA